MSNGATRLDCLGLTGPAPIEDDPRSEGTGVKPSSHHELTGCFRGRSASARMKYPGPVAFVLDWDRPLSLTECQSEKGICQDSDRSSESATVKLGDRRSSS